MGKAYTHTSKSFGATIKGDVQKELIYNSPVWFRHELNKFKDGECVSVIITSKKSKRTENQNRYYWGAYLPLIAEETGEHDLDSLHTLFKGKFLSKGIVRVLGHDVRLTKSTTELSTGEFSSFIADIYGLTGVMPPPTENYL